MWNCEKNELNKYLYKYISEESLSKITKFVILERKKPHCEVSLKLTKKCAKKVHKKKKKIANEVYKNMLYSIKLAAH